MTKGSKEQINTTKTTGKPRKRGVVVSDQMDKTVVVKVDTLKKHPRYIKRYISSKKYKAHDEKNAYKKGDLVIIEACRPRSKQKRWQVVGLIKPNK